MTSRVKSVRGHVAFRQLMRSRQRARMGSLQVRFVPPPDGVECMKVAYSVPRRVGGAVVRNRLRRQMRSIILQAAGEMPAGSYLISVNEEAVRLGFPDLQQRLVEAMQNASSSK